MTDLKTPATSSDEAIDASAVDAIDEAELGLADDEPIAAGDATTTGDGDRDDDASDTDALLVDLARAMHRAADVRRMRSLDLVERLRAVHVQEVRERGDAEAAAARAQTERDLGAIKDWAEGEIVRIHSERDRRSEARERELVALLDRQRAQLDWEIETVEGSVAAHRTDLDAFFTRLGSETDAATIARLALEEPKLPDLERVSDSARAVPAERPTEHIDEQPVATPSIAEDEAEPAMVGVMIGADEIDEDAPLAMTSLPIEADDEPEAEREPDSVSEPDALSELDAVSEPEAVSEPQAESEPVAEVGVPAGVASGTSSGTLLQALSALRPTVSWLNHGNGDGDKTA